LKQEKYLEQIKHTNSLQSLIKKIISIFRDFDGDEYIPAIIEEGNFTVDKGDDFYLKLVLKHQSIELQTTWLKSNMSFGLEEPTDFGNRVNNGAFTHNVITYRRYKSRNLYQLNPLLVSELINEYENTNTVYVNAFYNDEYSNIQGMPVLKSSNEMKLMVLKKVFTDFINDPNSNIYPKFELVAEFEYRTHNNHLTDNKSVYKTRDSYVKFDKNDNSIFVLGSIKIPFTKGKEKRKSRNIQVIDLTNLDTRKHNFNHYDGDNVEGFVCFRLDVMNVLKEFYYFYDLQMVDKVNIDNTYLVDVLEDKIVFWEAEYNKLPNQIKDKIDSYNFVPKDKKDFISEAMFTMQLEANWDWDKKLSPEYKLANLIREKAFNRAIDLGLSFIKPKNEEGLKQFILKIEALTDIKLEKFNQNSEDVKKLINIRQGESSEIDPKDIYLLYQKYCYAVQMEYSK